MNISEDFIEKVKQTVPGIEDVMDEMKNMSLPEVFKKFLPGDLGNSLKNRVMMSQLFQYLQTEKEGWVAHFVFDTDETPEDERMVYGLNAHTHGLEENYAHPDLQIVLNISPATCAAVFAAMVKTIKEYDGFHGSFTCPNEFAIKPDSIMFNIRTRWATEGDRRVVRVILPDENGCLDQDKMNPDYAGQYAGTSSC